MHVHVRGGDEEQMQYEESQTVLSDHVGLYRRLGEFRHREFTGLVENVQHFLLLLEQFVQPFRLLLLALGNVLAMKHPVE